MDRNKLWKSLIKARFYQGKMDKKGLQEYLSVWWIVLIVLSIGGVVVAVAVFYSADLDTRKFEADILNGKIEECIFQKGSLREGVLGADFDVFSECGLSEDVFDDGSVFYFEVNFFDFDGAELRKPIFGGEVSFAMECVMVSGSGGEKVKAEHFSRCSSKDVEFSEGYVNILTASNQKGEKVAAI